MTTKALEAWVLHKIPSGDSSLRVTFFTREDGIINCLCKGGRTPKKQAILQSFSPLWLALDVRKDWYFARQVEALATDLQLKGDSLFAGLYVNELLYFSLKPLDPQPELFAAYLQIMQGLSSVTDRFAIEILLRRFEWTLLQTCGHGLSFIAIKPELTYQYIAGQGFIPAKTGFPGIDLLALSEGRLEQVSVLKTAKLLMRQAIDHHLNGRILKSRSLYVK